MNEFDPKRIVSPIDLSSASTSVLQWAGYFGAAFRGGIEVVHVDHVEAPVYFTSGQLAELNQQVIANRRSLESMVRELAERTLGQQVPWKVKITEGPAIDELQKRLKTDQPDLVVMGSHGRSGVRRALLGSVAENLIRLANCPVLIVPVGPEKQSAPQIRTVLCPVNFTESARVSLSLSANVARAFDAELRVLHAIEEPGEPERTVRERLCSWIPADVRTSCAVTETVRTGNAAEQILRFVEESQPDLIVMSAEHRPLLEWSTIGTTTIRVMRHSEIPVLIVPRQTA